MSVQNLKLIGHRLFVGSTGYGKTTIAKALCKVERERGFATFVLDPVLQPDWGAHYLSDNMDEFCAYVWDFAEKNNLKQLFFENREPMVSIYLDECGDYTRRQWHELKKFQKKGRNYGIIVNSIGQRMVDIDKGARGQCTAFIVSGQSIEDAPILRNMTKSSKFDMVTDEFFPEMHYVIKEGNGKRPIFAKWTFDKRKTLTGGGDIEFLPEIPMASDSDE